MTGASTTVARDRASARMPALVAVAFGLTIATYAALFADDATVHALAGDERVIETIGAFAFGFASLFAVLAGLRTRRADRAQATWLFLLGFVLFLAFGEEISWGQHFLEFQTPAEVQELNNQAEFNLHNLKILDSRDTSGARKTGLGFFVNSNRFIDYFMAGLFLVLPLVRRLPGRLARWVDGLGLPRHGLELSAPLALNYALTAVSLLVTSSVLRSRATSEIREANSAFLCALLCIYLYLQARDSGMRR